MAYEPCVDAWFFEEENRRLFLETPNTVLCISALEDGIVRVCFEGKESIRALQSGSRLRQQLPVQKQNSSSSSSSEATVLIHELNANSHVSSAFTNGITSRGLLYPQLDAPVGSPRALSPIASPVSSAQNIPKQDVLRDSILTSLLENETLRFQLFDPHLNGSSLMIDPDMTTILPGVSLEVDGSLVYVSGDDDGSAPGSPGLKAFGANASSTLRMARVAPLPPGYGNTYHHDREVDKMHPYPKPPSAEYYDCRFNPAGRKNCIVYKTSKVIACVQCRPLSIHWYSAVTGDPLCNDLNHGRAYKFQGERSFTHYIGKL